MSIPWHRFLKVGLRQVFAGTCFEVHDEFDLSDQVQLVDFAVIRRGDSELPLPDKAHLPDGFQNLQDHNLISYKSMNEPFDRHALHELIGHAVTYSKLQSGDEDWREFSNQLGLIAISTRQPQTEVVRRLLQETDDEHIYEIDCVGLNVTCVVINAAPDLDRNWLWELLRGERSRWKNGKISAILEAVHQKLIKMGVKDPDIEAFESEVVDSLLEDLSKTARGKAFAEAQRKKGIEQGIEQVAIKMLSAGKTDREIAEFTDLSLETIKVLRQQLTR